MSFQEQITDILKNDPNSVNLSKKDLEFVINSISSDKIQEYIESKNNILIESKENQNDNQGSLQGLTKSYTPKPNPIFQQITNSKEIKEEEEKTEKIINAEEVDTKKVEKKDNRPKKEAIKKTTYKTQAVFGALFSVAGLTVFGIKVPALLIAAAKGTLIAISCTPLAFFGAFILLAAFLVCAHQLFIKKNVPKIKSDNPITLYKEKQNGIPVKNKYEQAILILNDELENTLKNIQENNTEAIEECKHKNSIAKEGLKQISEQDLSKIIEEANFFRKINVSHSFVFTNQILDIIQTKNEIIESDTNKQNIKIEIEENKNEIIESDDKINENQILEQKKKENKTNVIPLPVDINNEYNIENNRKQIENNTNHLTETKKNTENSIESAFLRLFEFKNKNSKFEDITPEDIGELLVQSGYNAEKVNDFLRNKEKEKEKELEIQKNPSQNSTNIKQSNNENTTNNTSLGDKEDIEKN